MPWRRPRRASPGPARLRRQRPTAPPPDLFRANFASGGGADAVASAVAGARDGDRGGKVAEGRAHGSTSLTQQQLVKLVSRLNGCLWSVTPRERRLLTLRTGFGLNRSYDPSQVAVILGVSRSRESQIERAAVTGLQHASRVSNCGSATRSLSALAIAAARTPFVIILRMLGPGQSLPAARSAGGSRVAGHARPQGRRHVGASRSAQAPGLSATGSAGSGAVISPPAQGGTDWLLLAAALASFGCGWSGRRGPTPLSSRSVRGGSGSRGARLAAGGWPPIMAAVATLPAVLPRPSGRRSGDGEVPAAEAQPAELPPPQASRRPWTSATSSPDAELQPEADLSPRRLTCGRQRDRGGDGRVRAREGARTGTICGRPGRVRRADELGHPEAAFHLGGILAEQGDFDGAELLSGEPMSSAMRPARSI